MDESLVHYVKQNKGTIVATIDQGLKRRIKSAGGSVVSLASDRIVME